MARESLRWGRVWAIVALTVAAAAGCKGDLSFEAPARPDTQAPCCGAPGDGPPIAEPPAGQPGDGEPLEVRAPIRRLTRDEYNHTVRDLFGDASEPANALPSDEIGNGFGNDADALSVSTLLAEQHEAVALAVAERAAADLASLRRWSSCVDALDETSEPGCARAIIAAVLPLAFRRPTRAPEIDALAELWTTLRQDQAFAPSIAGVFQAILLSPDFLYRPERGVADAASPTGRRPTGAEMATRLSYFLWGTMPDETLHRAAEAGELDGAQGVRRHAERMVDDPRARERLQHFFAYYLPIATASGAERSEEEFPDFTPVVGALMEEESRRFLDHVIFELDAGWDTALTASYSFLNEELATFYGVDGVSGPEFRLVELDTSKRRGILTQGAFLVGTTHSNTTSPVKRGGFVVNELLCMHIPFPDGDIADEISPPEPYSGRTARERYAQHSQDPACAGCHQLMDPAGFALEPFDAVGRWRDTENDVPIDARATLPGIARPIDGPAELAQALSETDAVYGCLASAWLKFALGRSDIDAIEAPVRARFASSGYRLKRLLVELTQTENFLYLPRE